MLIAKARLVISMCALIPAVVEVPWKFVLR